MIKKETATTAYAQIKNDLIFKIQHDVYKIGDQLPTNNRLCEIYEVSRITVNRALEELERDGYIERKQGKGCFVKFKDIKQNISKYYSFTEELMNMGYTPGSKFISLKKTSPNSEVKELLDLKNDDKVFLLERLRLANGVIVALDRSYLPAKFIPNFNKKMLVSGSLYQTLQDNYGFRPNHSEEIIEAISVTSDDSNLLHMAPSSPALLVKRVSFYDDSKVEFNYLIVNSNVFKYRVSLK